jgi:hypothetical protein
MKIRERTSRYNPQTTPAHTMLYLTPLSTSTVKDARFTSRGLTQQQGPVSKADVHAVPDSKQIAYDAYKANIDVFLAATANGKSYPTSARSFPFTIRSLTFPLALPSVVVSFREMGADTLKAAHKLLVEKSGAVTKIENIANHPNAFVVDLPDYPTIVKLLPAMRDPLPSIAGACSPKGLVALCKVFMMMELFFRTHTYPAFTEAEGGSLKVPRGTFSKPMTIEKAVEAIDTKSLRYPGGMDLTHRIRAEDKKDENEEGAWIGHVSDFPKEITFTMGSNAVYTAKPSPLRNSSACVGSPSQVPSLPGIMFPYFDGMNTTDTAMLRTTIATHFLRALGDDPRGEYVRFRNDILTASSTKSGVILAHMCRGLGLALDSQTQMYAIFDGKVYLGFALLGARWSIRVGNVWHVPLAAQALRDEIGTLRTHKGCLEDVITILRTNFNLDIPVDASKPMQIARVLPAIVWPGDAAEAKEIQERLETLLGRLDFGIPIVGLAAESLAKALSDIGDPSVALDDQYVHFPSAVHYHLLASRSGLVLSRFGSRVPSFSIAKGKDQIVVGKKFFEGTADAVKSKIGAITEILVVAKPFDLACKDFNAFLKKPEISQGAKERAAAYRHLVVTEKGNSKGKSLVIESLRKIVENIEVVAKEPKAKKRDATEAFVEADFLSSLQPASPVGSRAGSVAPMDLS